MSNDLILSLKNELANIQGDVDADTLAVAGGGATNKRISIKGGVFRKIANGKEIGAIEDRHMNIIFVKMAHDPSRHYYEGAYVEGEKVSPACWSNNAKVPDPEVKFPVAKSCDKCPMSVKGSGQNGKGTACRISWRTAVVLPTDPGGDVMQLVLPAASVFGDEEGGKWPFKSYVQMLANHNISAGRVVTKMQFDTKAPAPRVLFSPVGAVPSEDIAAVKEQGQTAAAENAIKMTVYQRDEQASVKAQAAPVATTEEGEVAPSEPKLREAAKVAPPAEQKDVADAIKKWAGKK